MGRLADSLCSPLPAVGMYTPQTFMNTFTSVHHIPGDGYWLSVLNAASIFGRVIPGVLADRYGKMTTLLPHLCIATLLLFLFPLFDNVSGRVALRRPDCSLMLLGSCP